MQGGLFGLTQSQKVYLYSSQLVPTLIVLLSGDLVLSMLFLQFFYITVSYIYVKWMSFQNSFYPYTSNQLGKLKWQIQKGMVLGFSAFLLISIYGIIFIKIGRVVLPHSVNLGWTIHSYWYLFILLCAINPILQEWYWRLFLPKTFQQAYYKLHVINVAYLLFHFVLFSSYVGFWRALPLVFTFFSVGRSMSHIKMKYGIMSSIVAHYGISFGGLVLYLYLVGFTSTQFIYK